jgi:predicted GNAT family acetyltransferase
VLHRYEIVVDGAISGYLRYERIGRQLVLVHTEVVPGKEGQGYAGELIRAVLHRSRQEKTPLVVVCPFVTEGLTRHPEYDDLDTQTGWLPVSFEGPFVSAHVDGEDGPELLELQEQRTVPSCRNRGRSRTGSAGCLRAELERDLLLAAPQLDICRRVVERDRVDRDAVFLIRGVDTWTACALVN